MFMYYNNNNITNNRDIKLQNNNIIIILKQNSCAENHKINYKKFEPDNFWISFHVHRQK